MSIREVAPEIPPCPLHGTSEGVERARDVAQPWVCSECVLVFFGSTSEWEQIEPLRRALMENRGQAG